MASKDKQIKLKVLDRSGSPQISNLLTVEDAQDTESMDARTEDSLLNTSRSSSECPSLPEDNPRNQLRTYGRKCCNCCAITTGFILTLIGFLLLIWSPFYILMETRLDMQPGLPAFEWWKTPPDSVFLRVYLFNYTNHESFMNGTDPKLKVEEIGPIVYLEKLRHVNVTHNDNDTLSYTSIRTTEYLPEYNKIDLNATVIIPNYAVLGIISHLSDASYFRILAFKVAMRFNPPKLFLNTTIYNLLWNISDPLLVTAKKMAPNAVASVNFGMLDTVYNNFADRATVYIGRKNGHKRFFLLDKFDGSEYLKGHGDTCSEKLVNGTEGALYPQYLTKDVVLRYWRRTLCRLIYLHFEKEEYMEDYNVVAYKYTKLPTAYNRYENLEEDCHKGDPVLFSGLSDISKCYHGTSMAASYPHFLYADERALNMVEGMKPNASIHSSYAYVEPITGIPISSVARSQSNFIIKDASNFNSDLQKFSNMILPMLWLEYEQEGLPYYVKNMINFTVNWCPKYQYYIVVSILLLGLYLLVKFGRKVFDFKQIIIRTGNYRTNTKIHFEKNEYLKETI